MIDFLDNIPLSKPLIFDSHAHYDDARFEETRNELLAALPNHGVCGVINCGCDRNSSKVSLKLSEEYDYIYAAVGVHPGSVDTYTAEDIKDLTAHKKCVAIGEIGLDYYWVDDNKEAQKKLFREQIILANELSKPVIVHDREAHADTLGILKEFKPKGVLHSFSGSPEMAKEIINLGMYIGIGGVITFKNAKKLPEVVRDIPLERILLETDAPYLTPVPFRSKTNHSAFIYLTAERISEIKGISIEEVLRVTKENCFNLFGI